ncbi:MAG: PAS domain-containing protein [Phaeodactylibacter sp.]|nr:PAS domain-containing protein [Phaeodactylibacter sp.]MCB9299548.1 PAS domain-containing protein [Lewinellaceae bacterium]
MKPNEGKSTVSPKEKMADPDTGQFPIVGIGASAGGLEALEQFLGKVPPDSGMAYVVIQHLDPTQKGMLPELLQRISNLAVFQVEDRMAVKPNCVYVIPPNKSLSILKGVLYLFEPIETRGLRLPIDFFLRSLAEDQKELAIGVILSGMGADGSIGIRAIKEKNGIVMVQQPETARFDSMPRNAIDSVLADIVAPANELPEKLISILRHTPVVKLTLASESEIKDKSAFEKIILLLRTYTGNDFSLYKKNTMYRRIERRMGVHQIDKIASYVRFLQENKKEGEILFKELMIGVTNFFRDPLVWEKLKEEVIPDLLANRPGDTIFRAWAPGCSTGEEAYSLAIVFKEALEKTNSNGDFSLQIFATDLDNEAIESARKGLFPAKIAADVSPARLGRFFVATDDGYRVSTEIREMIVFAQHNIIMHPPFTKIDILSCRNLLIYMDTELQKKLLGLFYYCINPNGIMVLGSSETPGTQSALFKPVDTKLKIYKRSATIWAPELIDFPASFSRTEPGQMDNSIPPHVNANIQMFADQLLLQHFSPVGVLVNENGDIIYTSGRTGKYLEPAVGKANLNIFAMLLEGLRNEFPVAFRKTIKTKEPVVLHHIKVTANGHTQTVNVNIQWIDKPSPLNGMIMIVFTDVPENTAAHPLENKEKKTSSGITDSEFEKELQHVREEMQSALEEMQTSEEELKTTNEELQSTNEELQSTNEELTTSKEEMQSMNEELQTVNAELQSKIDDFSRVDNDMKNLLNSTDIATLFLDKELNIRRYTDQATKIFKLIKSDIGRPFTDQASDLIYPELAADALEVLRTLIFIQKQIPTKDGRWFAIRIMPYRTVDDRIDGLVITFINLSDLKQVEGKLREAERMNRLLLNQSTDVILYLSTDWEILEFNPEAEKFFDKKRNDVLNRNFIQLCIPKPGQKKAEKGLKKILNEALDKKIEIQVIAAGGDLHVAEWSVNVLRNNLEKPVGTILSLKQAQKMQRHE